MLSSSTIARNGLGSLPRLRGVIFDMDGTLTVPNLDFKAMYSRCGVALSEDLLAAVAAMPASQSAAASAVIDEMEAEGRRTLQLAFGVVEMARWLESHRIPCAMVTRNTTATADELFSRLWTPRGLTRFPIVLTRDSHPEIAPKPHPGALRYIANKWGVTLPTQELLIVGDSPANDVVFGNMAGIATALVDTGRRYLDECKFKNRQLIGGADIYVESLAFLPGHLWTRYHIDSPLGTDYSLPKHDVPMPSTPACESAVAPGDEPAALQALTKDQANTPDQSGNTPLIYAADAGHIRCVKALLRIGVDVDRQGYLGSTACSRAARKGHVEVLEALLEAGVDPDIPNYKMQFPLHFAAFKRHPKAVQTLLNHGANPWVLDRKGRTPAQDTNDQEIRATLHGAMKKNSA